MTVAPLVSDSAYETSTATGTGALALDGAENGHQTLADAYGTGATNTFYYKIGNRNAAEWEVGIGYSLSGQLVRVSVIKSSNSDALVSFTSGTKDITSDIPAKYQWAPQEVQAISGSGGTWTADMGSGRHRYFSLTPARASKTPTAPTLVGTMTVESFNDGIEVEFTKDALETAIGDTLEQGDLVLFAWGSDATLNFEVQPTEEVVGMGQV